MKKILIINPWIEDFAAYDFWIKPIGLLKIAEWLRSADCKIKLIDCIHRNGKKERKFGSGKFASEIIETPKPVRDIPRPFKRYGISIDSFKTELRSFPDPDFLLLSCCMTYWYTGAFRVISMVREIYPLIKIIIGGNYPTLCPEHCSELSGADYQITNRNFKEIERRLTEILKIDPPKFSLEKSIPAYSLYKSVNAVPIITSFGCPFNCSYCASSILFPGFKQIKPNNVINELGIYIFKYGVRDIAFFDDALLVNAETHIVPILDWIIKSAPNCSFHLPNAVHPRYINQRLAIKMRAARFKTIRLGFESHDSYFQSHSGGKVTSDELLLAAEHLKSAGFSSEEAGVYLLYGNPGYEMTKVRESVEYVKKMGLKVYFATYSPIPATDDFWEAAKIEPRILTEPILHNPVLCRYEKPNEYTDLILSSRIRICSSQKD